jgi:UDP-glucose 4-epimerase
MAKYLVTGGAGFIGSHLTDALVTAGHEVRVIDNLATGKRANLAHLEGRIDFRQADVCDAQAVAAAVEGVDCVFHQAAMASVPRSVDRPFDTHNGCVTATLTLLDQARRAGVKRVVYAASSSAYGNNAWASKREADMPAPISPYAAAKLAGEFYCQAFFHTYGLETVCLRYFNVFGPRQNADGPYAAVVPRFMTDMLAGKRPVIFGDGQQARDFTFVENVVQANQLAASAPSNAAGKVYNIGSGRSISVLHVVASLNRVLRLSLEPVLGPPRVGDVRNSLADISLAQRDLGYEPAISFEEGLERTSRYYRS